MKTVLGLLIVVGLVAAGGAYYMLHVAAEPTGNFRTTPVKRDDLSLKIDATGTVEAEEFVDVGAQVAGRILSLGRDPRDANKSIDYGCPVHVDTVLAQIDDAVYKAQVDQAQATLVRAQADLEQLKAKRDQTEQEWKRGERLLPSKAIADTDYDLAVANYKMAKANVDVGEATIDQDKAMLKLAKTNLDYTVIKSPVEGVIIDRRVNIGQTVVAALNAPSLFLIAKDLRRVQVWASVNEADIGKIHPGLPVQFRVDAYPGEIFRGKVAQIRLNATMTQNVVTYTVVVETDNSDLRLLPYLTANLQFEIEQHEGVLLVPNAALRWKPRQPQQIAPEVREAAIAMMSRKGGGSKDSGGSKDAGGSKEAPGAKDAGGKEASGAAKAGGKEASGDSRGVAKAGGDAKAAKPSKPREERGRLWIKDGDYVRPIEVQVGATDGTNTEVSGTGLSEGMEAVIGEAVATDASSDTTNPFAPKFFSKSGRPKG
jgi:HlyD family secretion protein